MWVLAQQAVIQKRVRETIKDCINTISIKDDILVHGKDNDHDKNLIKVLKTLSEKGLTLQKEKNSFGQPEVKWFGNIYTEKGMSPDPENVRLFRTGHNHILCRSEKFSTDRAIQRKIFIRKRE